MWTGYSFLYLFVALAPFIIVSSIVMISIFMYDAKGIFFLFGLIFTMFINRIVISDKIPDYPITTATRDPVCNVSFMNFIDSGTANSPFLPKNTIINAYTLGYFSYCISSASTRTSNGTMIAFFVLLLLGDLTFNIVNNCAGTNLFIALAYGILFGVMCAFIVEKGSEGKMLYFFSGTGAESCGAATQQKFRCTVTQNGQLH
jgi:hypothetical protein